MSQLSVHFCLYPAAGPAHWPEMFGPCSGTSQSPVNINVANKEEVLYDENLTDDLDLLTANTDANYFMVNNAHTGKY